MTNPYHRTPIKMDEARVAAEVMSEIAYGQEPELVVEAAKLLELYRLNQHVVTLSGSMARIADALDRLAPK
jgi:hypothetical protein